MKLKEVIELLELDYSLFPDDGEHYNVASKILKKQIPIKPRVMETPNDESDGFWWYCGHCGASRRTKVKNIYCSFCGGKIDWSEFAK